VRTGGRYPMDDGHVVVDSVEPITLAEVTDDLARESGFQSVDDLLRTARHGSGQNVYLIRFRYLPPGGWETRTPAVPELGRQGPRQSTRLQNSSRRRNSR
jgi:hypothetical protein